MSNRGNVITSFWILCALAGGMLIGQAITRRHYQEKTETQIQAERLRMDADRKRIIEYSAKEAVNAVAVVLQKTESDVRHWQNEYEKLRQVYITSMKTQAPRVGDETSK